MSTTNDGGPAFCTRSFGQPDTHPGMSLRDYFAGQALVGLVSRLRFISNDGRVIEGSPATFSKENRGAIANIAYLYADDMLAVREKRDTPATIKNKLTKGAVQS